VKREIIRRIEERLLAVWRMLEVKVSDSLAADRSWEPLERWVDAVLNDPNTSNYFLAKRYAPRTYRGDALLILSETDRGASAYWSGPEGDRRRVDAWKKIVRGNMDVYRIPGTHSSIMREPSVKLVANTINEHMLKTKTAGLPLPKKA
jgi:thioesterase domain-containing protein